MAEFLTADIPGTGGTIKEVPEDFLVEEIPLYPPCGDGEHLYVTVEKRGLTTFDLLTRLAQIFKVPERELGYAGLKDARATTRQTISIPGIAAEKAQGLEEENFRIVAACRHRNKLRLGHLAGNRFTIRIRQVESGALPNAEAVLRVLAQQGVPNRFGSQRYGSLDNTHRVGRALLQRDFAAAAGQIVGDPQQISNERWRRGATAFAAGDLPAALAALPGRFRNERSLIQARIKGRSWEEAVLALPRKLLRLYFSAYQSQLFDRLVDGRLAALGTLWEGDLAYKHANGACFLVADAAAEQSRADRLEISPTAPLFGRKVSLPQGRALEQESALLTEEGLRLEDFAFGGGLGMDGERRPLRVPLGEATVDPEGTDLLTSFALPRGSYATSVLREIMKT